MWLPGAACAQDDAALRKLVASQAALVEALQRRVAALEAREVEPVRTTSPVAPLSVPTVPPAAATTPIANGGDRPPVAVDWSEGGPNFQLADGTSFHLRGRLFIDGSTTIGSRFATRDISGTEISSARLGVDGRYGEHWSYKVELDFADGAASLKENYIAYSTRLGSKDLKIYAGNKTGDRSIDGASYDGYVPFFQRTMLATSVGPEKGIFGVGVLAQLIGNDWHVGANVVGDDANGNAGTADDTLTYVGRATWTPALDRLTRLHIGAWGYYEAVSAGNATINRSIYPGQHFDDNARITMTPIEGATSSSGEGAELGALRGSFWVFGEYGRRAIKARQDDRTWTSAVVEAGFFVTGEKPNFSPCTGNWTQVVPRHSFLGGGTGAIELAARFETIDLGKTPVAGSGNDATLTLNWFPTRNLRAILDWVHWNITDPMAPYVGRDRGDTLNVRLEAAF